MNCTVRRMRADETGALKHFLYLAIFVPEGETPPPESILDKPELRVYIDGFGRQKGDMALLAEADGHAIGAVWARVMDDYGHVDDDTPSLAISVEAAYRGQGVGTALMRAMLECLRRDGWRRVSLSVQKQNRAVGLYRAVGFQTLRETPEEYIMVCPLDA